MLEAGKKLRSLMENILDALFNSKSENTVFAQTIRQTVSGGITTIVDLVVFQLFIMLGISMYIAAVFSGLAAFCTNFTLTKLYVFKNKSRNAIPGQLVKYICISLISLLITQVCLLVFTKYIVVSPLVAKIMSVPIVFIWTVASNRIIFMKKSTF